MNPVTIDTALLYALHYIVWISHLVLCGRFLILMLVGSHQLHVVIHGNYRLLTTINSSNECSTGFCAYLGDTSKLFIKNYDAKGGRELGP